MCREGLRHQEVVTLYIVSVSYHKRDWIQNVRLARGLRHQEIVEEARCERKLPAGAFPPVCIAVRFRSREPGSRPANCRLAVDERHIWIYQILFVIL